jgi:hypothetical protein
VDQMQLMSCNFEMLSGECRRHSPGLVSRAGNGKQHAVFIDNCAVEP